MDTGKFEGPSLRCVFGRYAIITIECDPDGVSDKRDWVEFLDEQLSWFRRSGNSSSSFPFSKMIDWLQQFSDYRGVVANYSGHKSLHIHLVFDTSIFVEQYPELRDTMRPSFIEAYKQVKAAFEQLMQPTYIADDIEKQIRPISIH